MCSSRLLFTGAPEQDGAKKERHDKWHSWDSDNKTGTGVPWRREGSRVRILDPSDQEEQQCDPIHDHACATCPAPQPLDSAEGSRKRRRREIGQKARTKSTRSKMSSSERRAWGTSPACCLAKNTPNAKIFQMRYNGPLSMIAAKPRVA